MPPATSRPRRMTSPRPAPSDRRTPDDDYMINTHRHRRSRSSTNDMAGADQAAEAAADSPAMPHRGQDRDASPGFDPGQQPEAYRQGGQLRQAAGGHQSHRCRRDQPDHPGLLSSATISPTPRPSPRNRSMRPPAAGKTPDARHPAECCSTSRSALKDEAGAEKTLEELVADYNDPKDWTQMIDVAITSKGMRDVDSDLAGPPAVPGRARPVSPAGRQHVRLRPPAICTFFGDARERQDSMAAPAIPDPTAARRRRQEDHAAADRGRTEARTAHYNAKLAEALYSYGMYPEAEAAAKLAISKGGMTDPRKRRWCWARRWSAQGKYDDAIAAFGKVTGGGPATAAHHAPVGGLCQHQEESARAAPAAAAPRNKPMTGGARCKACPAFFLSEPKPMRAA